MAKTQREEIFNTLRNLMVDSMPISPGEEEIHVPFLEMGANSLILMEVQRAVENTFGITISIPQFFEELTTIDALVTYIDQNLSQESPTPSTPERSEPTPPQISIPQPITQMPGDIPHELEQIFTNQIEITSQALRNVVAEQLKFLKSQGLAISPQMVQSTLEQQNIKQSTQERLKPDRTTNTTQKKERKAAALPQQLLSPLEIRSRGLTPQQSEHLEDLIKRYTERTPKSKETVQKQRKALADSRAAVGFRFSTKEMLYPIIGDRAKGAYLWDIDGNRYVDITMGQGVTLLGHHPECIEKALREQPADIAQLGPRPIEAGEAAELICEFTGMDRVTFTNSGTEAVMAALRLARGITKKQTIVIFQNAYHGHADSVMGMPVTKSDQLTTQPVAPGTPPGAVEDLRILEYDSDKSLEYIQKHIDTLAGVMVEPVQSRNPDVQPKAFLKALRKITKAGNVPLIFDEMITGFRVHPGGAQAWFGVKADIATYGKVIGGGMPIGVVAGRADIMDQIDGGDWRFGDTSYPKVDRVVFGGTFCQHPLAMLTTLATLRHMKKEGPGLQENLNKKTKRLADTLNLFFEQEGYPIKVVYFGSLFRLSFSSNLELLFYHLMIKGVFIWEWRSYFLSTAHSEQDIDTIIEAIKESVEALRMGGFIPRQRKKDAAYTYPLNTAQKQLLALAQISPEGSKAYHLSPLLELKGPLDTERLKQAVEGVVARHDALRSLIKQNQQQIQPYNPQTDVFTQIDLKGEHPDQWLKKHATTGFDLLRGPLFVTHLLKMAPEKHLFILKGHHIILDGLSMNLIIHEIATHYNQTLNKGSKPLKKPLQFLDYIQWYEKKPFQHLEKFWLDQQLHTIPPLTLPTDYPEPTVKPYRGGRITHTIATSLFLKVQELSKKEGCTHFMTLFAIYTLWLHRIANQENLITGIPVAGRGLKNGDHLVGFCTHLIPIHSQIDWNAPFKDYLRSIRGKLLKAYQHQDYPFAELIEKLRHQNSTLLSTVFNLDRPGEAPDMAQLQVTWQSQPIYHTAFDITFNLTEIGEKLVLECDYSQDRFNPATMERFVTQFHTLLKGVIDTPERNCSTLPRLSEEERKTLLIDWNQTQTPIPSLCVHQLFEQQVKETPQAIAIIDHEIRLTFTELNREANQLAHRLQNLGIGPEKIVAIHMMRSHHLMVAILATLKAGGAFLPLDPSYPKARLNFMLEDANASILITQKTLSNQLTAPKESQVILIDQPEDKQYPEDNPDSLVNQTNLVYLLYTSGSTGRPKGTMIHHRGAINYLTWAIKQYQLHKGDGAVLYASIGFDATLTSLLTPLLSGQPLTIVSDQEESIQVLCDLLTSEKQWSLTKATPAHLEIINATVPHKQLDQSTRALVIGGEALFGHTVTPWRHHAPETRIYNEYGPTETVVGCAIYEVKDRDPKPGPVPIGVPIANTQLYILDQNLQPVPIGVVGELFIGGAGVARGYLNRPELTKKAFIPIEKTGLIQPESTDNPPSGMLYRTGDLVRWQDDGQMVYLGRMDNQIKLRGFRIELSEIEENLSRHPRVREAVVLLQERSKTDQRLIAYLVTDTMLSTPELREFLKQSLPDHMIPNHFITRSSMPLTDNGKVDRKALLQQTTTEKISTQKRFVPLNSTEKQIAKIWKDILELEQVGNQDNFFEIGGHSLLILPLRNRLKETFNRAISPVDIFQYPTIQALANHLMPKTHKAPQKKSGRKGRNRRTQRASHQKAALDRFKQGR
ncbi:amino acid adenylation domain-containing protein [Magnetococcales bacterium HHB-1]